MSLDVLLKYGSWRLRHEQPDSWLDVIQGWLEKDSFPYIKLGLQALIPVLEDREFNNLPPIYRLLLPLLSAPQPALISDLQNVIIALEQRSSGETAYFLRQIIYRNPIPDVLRLVRRVLPLLSSDTQKNLHDVVKEFSIPE